MLVALTPEGQALLERKRAEWRDRWDDVLADVDAADIETAARVIAAASGDLLRPVS